MKRLFTALCADEAGFILSAELVIIATVVVLGMTAMLVAVRDSIGGEMMDLANSFRSIDQSYGYAGMRGCRTTRGWTSWTAGSTFYDEHLRDKYPEEIIVADHVVGTVSGVKQPCGPVCPPACPAPVCPTPPCLNAPILPDCGPQLHPRLEAPCIDCPPTDQLPSGLPSPEMPQSGWPSSGWPSPGSDLEPSTNWSQGNAFYPPFSQPVTRGAYGPLQVW